MNLFSKYFWHDIYYTPKRGIKNLFYYFKIVWRMTPWDSQSIYEMMRHQLIILCKSIENGYEVEETKLPKVKDIKRCIELLTNIIEDNHMDRCGYDNNYKISFEPINKNEKDSDNKIYELVTNQTPEQKEKNHQALINGDKLSNQEIDELFNILKQSRSWWD